MYKFALTVIYALSFTPLMVACQGDTELKADEKPIQSKVSQTDKTDSEDSWLMAIKSGDLSKVKQLVNEGKSIGLNQNGLNLPLRFAVDHRQTIMLRYLLEQGATMETERSAAFTVPGPTGMTADNILSFAPDSSEIIKLLLENGARPNLIGVGERAADDRPLLVAVQKGNLATVNLLLKYGADPNLGGENPDTAIGWAINSENEAILKALLKAGADVNILPSSGGNGTPLSITQACTLPAGEPPQSPLDLAQDNEALFNILKAAGAKSTKDLCA